MDYPPEVSTFTVTGKLMYGVGNLEDGTNLPNLIPVPNALLEFRPDLSEPVYRLTGMTIFQEPVLGTTNGAGDVCGIVDGTPNVVLPYGGDLSLTPNGWPWVMTVKVEGFADREFRIMGTAGGTVDLGTVVSVPAFPDEDIPEWESASATAIAARDAAVAAAAAAAASNPGAPNGTAQLDSSSLLKSSQTPTRLTAAGLAASMADLAAAEGLAVSNVVARSVGLDVKAYGAKGDGTTDDTTAINAALTAAGTGGRVMLTKGVYKVTGTLTIPQWCTLEGHAYEQGAGGSSPTELKFTTVTGAAVGIVAGSLSTLRNLLVRGPGTMVGTTIGIDGATMFLDRVSVNNWATGIRVTGGYYATFQGVEWSRNKIGLNLISCYNVNLFAPRFYCGSTVDDAPQVAIAGGARSLNIFGGAIEGYASAVVPASNTALGMYGVYFETGVNANAGGVWADGKDKVSVTAIGCMVYLNGHTRWITTSGSTNVALFARGNQFVAVSGSVQVPTAYIIAADQAVDIGSDNWSEVAKAGSSYVSATGGLPAAGTIVSMPAGISTGAMVYDGRRYQRGMSIQTLATAGAVMFDVLKGDQFVTLNANATSSSITNASTIRDVMRITWVQDATGGRTYAWPSICKFAGNSAPSDTTLNTMTTVTFRYNTSTGRWNELSRAVAVPVS